MVVIFELSLVWAVVICDWPIGVPPDIACNIVIVMSSVG